MDEKEYVTLIEEGKKYIYNEKYEEWEEFCKKIAPNYIKTSLEIIKLIHNQSVNAALVYIHQIENEISKDAFSMIAFIVTRFSKKGPEFYTRLRGRNITEEEIEIVKKFEEENRELKNSLQDK